MNARLPLPISDHVLNAIRLNARKRFVTSGNGAFLRRKLGQSLEYREHRAYLPGDDARFIDWRASARQGGKRDFLIRSFESEEQFSLLIVVDTGATMRLPEPVSKLQTALWICEAFAKIAEKEKLQIAFLPLNSGSRFPLRFAKNRQIASALDLFMKNVWQPIEDEPDGDDEMVRLRKRLPPASATLFISDFYHDDDQTAQFVQLAKDAARGMRQVIVCELDSWAGERTILKNEIVNLRNVGAARAPDGYFQASDTELEQVDEILRKRRTRLRKSLNIGGVVQRHWDMPEDLSAANITAEFQQWLHHFILSSELFGRMR